MIIKKIINPERLRRINGGFSFIPHRFLSDGFLTLLNHEEILLYFFLVLASDRKGLSYYSYDSICKFLGLDIDEYLEAREGLLIKDLIAFTNTTYQVLELPLKPIATITPKPPTIDCLIRESLKEV